MQPHNLSLFFKKHSPCSTAVHVVAQTIPTLDGFGIILTFILLIGRINSSSFAGAHHDSPRSAAVHVVAHLQHNPQQQRKVLVAHQLLGGLCDE